MIKEFMEFLAGIKMTIVAAFFLLLSLFFMIYHINVVFDPAIFTVLISGTPIVFRAFIHLFRQKRISSPLLISIAMISAITIGELFAAGEVALIMAIGEILEDVTVDKAQKGLARLIDLTPLTGRKIFADGRDKIIPIAEINIGDTLRVLPGETIPADGIIIKGCTSINQAALTGESLPADKEPGDAIMAGTINCFGAFDMEVKAIKDTYLQRMIKLVKEAQCNKAPTQKIVDKWAAILVPTALLIALLTYFITGEIIRAVTVLVVFCPCALVLATPTSIMAAIGQAAKFGILIKSGEALEKMGAVNTIVFDKTGTLTSGTLQVSDIISFKKSYPKDDVLALAASLECYSEHTLAAAVVSYARNKNITFLPITDFYMAAGRGVSGFLNQDKLVAGNLKFLAENGIELSSQNAQAIEKLQSSGCALIIIAKNKDVIGAIILSDTVRQGGKQLVSDLKQLGVESYIFSGDYSAAVKHLAKALGIKSAYAEMLPTDKVYKITDLQKKGKFICMTGDGINDAAAMKMANIGVAMGKIGSDITVDAADIALINDNLASLPYLYKLAKLTIRTIQMNITISMTLNILGILLSVTGILTPISGAILHNAGSVIVVLNAGHLYEKRV